MPILARIHQPVAPGVRLVRVRLPPGLWVGFGIDLGPAFTHIGTAQLEHWGIKEATLVAAAMRNLERRAAAELDVSNLVIDGVPVTAVQASGWGSAILLAPSVLAECIGPEPSLVFAPVRNILFAVPVEAPAETIVRLWDGMAIDDPTELDGDVYRFEGGRLEPSGARRDPGGGLIVERGAGAGGPAELTGSCGVGARRLPCSTPASSSSSTSTTANGCRWLGASITARTMTT